VKPVYIILRFRNAASARHALYDLLAGPGDLVGGHQYVHVWPTIWAYKTTGSATAFRWLHFLCCTLLLVSPAGGGIGGSLNRKLLMMINDLASVATIAIMFLYFGGSCRSGIYISRRLFGDFSGLSVACIFCRHHLDVG
jgi:hypothetical protein